MPRCHCRFLSAALLFFSACGFDDGELPAVDELEQELAATPSTFPDLTVENASRSNGTFENGYGFSESAAWQKPWARVSVGSVANGFSVAYSEGWGDLLSTSAWVGSTNGVKYVDSNVNSNQTDCTHPVTRSGAALVYGCTQVVGRVCNVDPYCCTAAWDPACVDEAADMGAGFSGSHAVTVTGSALPSSHSGCAAVVDAKDSYCATTNWDAMCVDEAYQLCYARYVTHPRIEDGRLMADACVEPTVTGAPSCPVGATGTECCRRSLVLNGVYMRHPDGGAATGHRIEWRSWANARTPTGRLVSTRTTLVPDPCTGPLYFNYAAGAWMKSCSATHPLWQLAGPSRALYPDCPNVANTSSSTCSPLDAGHQNARVRTVVVETLTALINSNSSYPTDVRYTKLDASGQFGDVTDPGLLPPDTSYPSGNTNAVWYFNAGTDVTTSPYQQWVTGRPVCRRASLDRLGAAMSGVAICPSGSVGISAIRTLWR